MKRKSCEFGKKCNRKNPSHRKEFAHPGDDDYASEGDEKNTQNDDEDDDEEVESVFRHAK